MRFGLVRAQKNMARIFFHAQRGSSFFQFIGHPVEKLRRVRIGFLEDEKLRPGQWRFLTDQEVSQFKREFKK